MSLFHHNAIFLLYLFFLPLFLLTFLHCIFFLHLIFLCVPFIIVHISAIFCFSSVFINKANITFFAFFFTNVFLSLFTPSPLSLLFSSYLSSILPSLTFLPFLLCYSPFLPPSPSHAFPLSANNLSSRCSISGCGQ